MNSKTNRRNHDFQIDYFQVRRCGTADGAYALLCDHRENRLHAIKTANAMAYRVKSRLAWAAILRCLFFWFPPINNYAKWMAAEVAAHEEVSRDCYEAAIDELRFIERCITAVNPHRKYRDKPDREAHELAQREEWKHELKRAIENFLITSGTIPHDYLDTMRCHPDFATELLPHIINVEKLLLAMRAEGESAAASRAELIGMMRLPQQAFALPDLGAT